MNKENWQKKFEEDLDKWLETKGHQYTCMAYNEGQYCCLDSAPKNSTYGGRGRRFVINWIKNNL